jgi:hypothetical protein
MLSKWYAVTRSQKIFLLGWAAFLIISSLLTLYFMGSEQYTLRQESSATQAFHLASGSHQHDSTELEATPPKGHEKDLPLAVDVGVYLDRVAELSILGSDWKADFYVWFNWEGDAINPGETFHVVNGEVLTKALVEKHEDGKRHYALYRVTAQITKVFDVSRFPRNDHLLSIDIEDGASQSYQIKYVTNKEASDVSGSVAIPGFKIIAQQALVKPHLYKTTRGNPKLSNDFKATYSQFSYSVWIARPTWSLYLKMFVVMFGAVFTALLGFFVKSSADRVALVSGSLFAAVANMYIASTLIPDTGVDTLADHINWIGAAFIMVAIVQTVIYQYSFEGREDRKEVTAFFDWISFTLMLAFYIGLNLAIPLLASI